METLIRIAQFILSFSLLVLLHEGGHYLASRLTKTRVEKFYLFFNPWFTLFKKKVGHTEWGIGWLPVGGYAKISGMVDESFDTDPLKEKAKPWEYRSKSVWARLLISGGGILMNIILAFIIYTFLSAIYGTSYLHVDDVNNNGGIQATPIGKEFGFQTGDKILKVGNYKEENFHKILGTLLINAEESITVERNREQVVVPIKLSSYKRLMEKGSMLWQERIPLSGNVVGSVLTDMPAHRAGILPGDTILEIDNVPFAYLDELLSYLDTCRQEDTMRTMELYVATRTAGRKRMEVALNKNSRMGYTLKNNLPVRQEKYSVGEALMAGVVRCGNAISLMLKQLRLLGIPETESYKQVGGVIAFVNIFPASWDWFTFWNLTAFLSIMLAILNLLPIPALDGGHILFLLVEAVSGRKLGDRFLLRAQQVGFAILILLLIFANGNDLFRLFGGG